MSYNERKLKKMKPFLLKTGLSFLLFASILLFAGCKGRRAPEEPASYDLADPQKRNEVILKVGDSFYFNADFEKYVRSTLGDDLKALNAVSLSRLFDDFVEERILLQAAKNRDISLSWEEKKEYLAKLSSEFRTSGAKLSTEEMDTNILFERLLIQKYNFELVKNIEVKEEEIKQYYELNKKEFMRPERIQVSQILLDTENKAIEIYERVKDASEEEFRAAAQEESVSLEASKGGQMGVFEMGQLPFEMETVIFSLKEGEISPVVESSYGYHIFRLDKRQAPELVSEKEAAPSIKLKLLELKVKNRISDHLEELKGSIEWTFYPENLSFPYQRIDL